MTDIAVVVLVGNEAIHIGRCLDRLRPLEAAQTFVVDSGSTDQTCSIALSKGAILVEHPWPGNQALQFNWFLSHSSISATWVLRVDADEWLSEELIEEIKEKIFSISDDVNGIILKRRHYFAGGWAKHGTYPVRILRLFRAGEARYDDGMLMDEHLVVNGRTIEFDNDFVDESLISMEQWREKHREYARREATMVVSGSVNANKALYYRLPPYFRAIVYFCIRYFLKGGFLDGYAGWMWNFWQGLWYRWIVDREIGRLKKGIRD